MSRCVRRVVAIGLCGFATGCTLLAAKPDVTRHYVLSATVGDARPSQASGRIEIGVGPVEIPRYLDRSEIVTRLAQNEIDLSSVARWGEPLDEGMARVLGANLAVMLDHRGVALFPWRGAEPRLRVSVVVERFENVAGERAVLIARWVLRDAAGSELAAQRGQLERPIAAGGDTSAAVLALSHAVEALAGEIAAAIRSVP